MATSKSKVAAAKKLAQKIKSKKTTSYKKQGQAAPQSSSYKPSQDKKVAAKPVGHRWTDAGAARLGKDPKSTPSKADVAKYGGRTFKFKGEDTRYIYSENRVDKSDKSLKNKFEEGGTLGAGSFKLGGGLGVKGRQKPNYRKDIDAQKEAKPAGWRFTDKLAKRLNKSLTARPTAEEIKKYRGKGVYFERRQDKADAKPSKRYISLELGGETPDELLHIKHVYVDVYEDDYEKGEGEHANTYEMKDLRGAKVKASEIVKWAEKYVGTSGDASNYIILDGRIDTDRLEDEDGNELSKSEIEEWKKGKKKAYVARYSILVEAIKLRDITSDEELSRATGISSYEQGGELNGSNITGAGMFKGGGGVGVSGRQYNPYSKDADGQKQAKPAGWRFTNKLADRLDENRFARPDSQQIKKYKKSGGVYFERREDKADAKPSKRYISLETGGDLDAGQMQGAGMFAGGGELGVVRDLRVLNQIARKYKLTFDKKYKYYTGDAYKNNDGDSLPNYFVLGDRVFELKYFSGSFNPFLVEIDPYKLVYRKSTGEPAFPNYPNPKWDADKFYTKTKYDEGGDLDAGQMQGAGMFAGGGVIYKEVEGFEMAFNSKGRMLKPTKELYPYDAATGWSNLNTAKIMYRKFFKENERLHDYEIGEERFAGGGGVHRVSNRESREYSENMLPFKANNLEGKTLSNGDYAVISYGYYPIWYYSKKESKWYGNKDKYSVTTAKHISQSRPTYDAEMLGKAELLDKMMSHSASFENGGAIDVLSDAPYSPVQTTGGTGFSTGDLTSHMTMDNLAS